MRIGEIADRLALNPKTIRCYESVGLCRNDQQPQDQSLGPLLSGSRGSRLGHPDMVERASRGWVSVIRSDTSSPEAAVMAATTMMAVVSE